MFVHMIMLSTAFLAVSDALSSPLENPAEIEAINTGPYQYPQQVFKVKKCCWALFHRDELREKATMGKWFSKRAPAEAEKHVDDRKPDILRTSNTPNTFNDVPDSATPTGCSVDGNDCKSTQEIIPPMSGSCNWSHIETRKSQSQISDAQM